MLPQQPIPVRSRLSDIAVGIAALALSCNALWCNAQSHSTAISSAPLAIVDVTIIDVAHARRLLSRTVLIDDGHIAKVGKSGAVAIPPAAERIDGRGKFLIPGLVDMHVHLFNNATHRPPNDWTFPLFVANGVTGVREMAARPEQIAQVKRWNEKVDGGMLVAPHVFAAGVAVNGASESDVRAKVREAAEQGADFIKVFSEVPAPQWHAIIDEARQQHIPVDGHVPATVTLIEAARAGQRTAEHLMQAYEACSSVEKEMIAPRRDLAGDAAVELRDQQEREVLGKFDRSRCMQSARMVAQTRQAQTPTLVLSRFETIPPGTDFETDPRWPLLRADEHTRWRRILEPRSADDVKLAAQRWKVSCEITRIMNSAGVTLLAGTDTPMPLNYPGYSLHDELELFAECGVSAAQALQAATTRPAQILKLADRGSIDDGKRADLVLLDADPLRDIRNLRRIRAVVLAGRVLQREQLDAMLPGAVQK